MLIVKSITIMTTQNSKSIHTHFHAQIELFQQFLFHQHFQYIVQSVYQQFFSALTTFIV